MTEAKAKFEHSASDYALTVHAVAEAPALELPYLPPIPKDRSTGIALVGDQQPAWAQHLPLRAIGDDLAGRYPAIASVSQREKLFGYLWASTPSLRGPRRGLPSCVTGPRRATSCPPNKKRTCN
jgi:hypothetical protein